MFLVFLDFIVILYLVVAVQPHIEQIPIDKKWRQVWAYGTAVGQAGQKFS